MRSATNKRVAVATLLFVVSACTSRDLGSRATSLTAGVINPDSMGATPSDVQKLPMREPPDLLESSGVVISPAQPDIIFTFNDSGNKPYLFAMDTAGNARGRWKIDGADNRDWEAASRGLCSGTAPSINPSSYCLFIGDVGDNGAVRSVVTLYQVPEPLLSKEVASGNIAATALRFRYPDAPHDVEAMYIGPDRTTYLITKRALPKSSGALRPSLVFTIPGSAWSGGDTVVATLLDSLPIVPGSSELRQITDASLSSDSRLLAVRTYGQLFVFATDSLTGRVINSIPPAVCNIEGVEKKHGEGVAWTDNNTKLLLTNEGRNAPMHRITCPLPQH